MSSIMRVIEQLQCWASLQGEFGMPVDQTPHRKLNKVLTFYEPGAGLPPARVAKFPSDEEKNAPSTGPEYWSVTCKGLTEFTGLRCRNGDAGFEAFTVAPRVGLGLAGRPSKGGGALSEEIAVRLQLSDTESELSPPYVLPLDPTFHFQTWTVQNTVIHAGTSTSWPVPGRLDYAVVHIFVFDIHPDGSVTPLVADEYEDRADVSNLLNVCRRFSPAAKNLKINDDAEPVARAFFKDNLFRTGGNIATVEVGNETRVKTVPTRIMVAVSWTGFKETSDYQPSGPFPGVAGAARFWPVIQVASTKRVAEVKASVEVDRPSTSEWDSTRGCHGSRAMGSMLVMDTNYGARIGTPVQEAPASNWSSLFNYFVTDAETDIGLHHEIHMVRAWKKATRQANSVVLRKAPGSERAEQSRLILKCEGEGEFDNVHVAPKMSLVGAKYALVYEYLDEDPTMPVTPTLVDLSDRGRFKLDDLSMAPFCAHDCFHMHWRWTDAGPGPQQLGFVGYEPAAKPGVPMVPDGQDVYLWFRAKGWFTYHAEHFDEHGADPRTWVPVCHHGAAYLTSSDTAAIKLAKVDVERRSRVTFLKSADPKDRISSDQSWSVFYWNIRYYMEMDSEGRYRAVDRTTPTDAAGLLSARKL